MEVQAFDSFEEMQAAMSEAHDQWTALTTVTQTGLLLGQGFFWFQWIPEYELSAWGERWSVEKYAEYLQSRADQTDDPDTKQEWLDTIESDREGLARGYVFSKAYSEACDYGELGDTHVSQMVEVSREAFEWARLYHWDIKAMLRDLKSRPVAVKVTDDWNVMITERADLIEKLIAIRKKEEISKTISEVLREEGS